MSKHIYTGLVALFGLITVIGTLIAFKHIPFGEQTPLITILETLFIFILISVNILVSLIMYGEEVFKKWTFQLVLTLTLIDAMLVVDAIYGTAYTGYTSETFRAFGIFLLYIFGCFVSWSSLIKHD